MIILLCHLEVAIFPQGICNKLKLKTTVPADDHYGSPVVRSLGRYVGGLGELGKCTVERWLVEMRAKMVEAAEADQAGVEPPVDTDKVKETIMKCAQPLLRSLYSQVIVDLGVKPVKATGMLCVVQCI